ncbi:MAG: ORF6N domain-containing protein [Spirochaetaceae bacterium]|jgi:hypothetical protein|nr:ORF6N domain-containing protein [Spirochaetaceae bacterium]
MVEMIDYKQVEEKIVTIRNTAVILDNAVAELYGVETREINQAVKNNAEKFPTGYIIPLYRNELSRLKSKILISNNEAPDLKAAVLSRGGRRNLPNAFTEKGL